MGKMKMGQDPRNKAKSVILGQNLVRNMPEAKQAPIIPGISEDRLQEAMQNVLDTHSDLFKRLAELEAQEPLTTMVAPSISCQCSPAPAVIMPKMIDKRARLHSRLLKAEMLKERKELDSLLTMYVQSIDRNIDEMDSAISNLNNAIMSAKPEQIQVVKEIIVEKPVTDKKVYIAIAISMILNITLVLLK